MPATEQTWRDLKILHVVFAITAIVLLGSTVAMLVADHDRPWKTYARGFRDLETWSAAARVEQQDLAGYRSRGGELAAALAEARRAPLEPRLAEAFVAATKSVPEDAQAAARVEQDIADLAELQARVAELGDAEDAKGEVERLESRRFDLRGDLLERMLDVTKRAKFREDLLAGALKLRKAEFDKNRADYELAVADEAPAARQAELLTIADAKRAEVGEATVVFQAANTYRKELQSLLGQITASEDTAAKAVADHRGQLAALQKTYDDRRSNWGKTALELPVLDAFNGPLQIEQLWLPDLTINNNFRNVARFDRCVTCHRGMDKTMPGAPQDPAYPEAESVAITLPTPSAEEAAKLIEAVKAAAAERGQKERPEIDNDSLQSLFGLRLAPRGVFSADDPTVSVVLPAEATPVDDEPEPSSAAARAGLLPGDVIEEVNGRRIAAASMAFDALLETPQWGSPLALTVRRGVPQPYSTHPRLDLFVSDSSPHPMKTFGCTICHEGQGSSTSFKWASHTPNSPKQAHAWHDEYGWFNNHHWIFPMRPERFEESSCLKCHHQVVDLEPSEKFPEPPAPKLVEGYHLIRQYGCYGCHEINGYAGPDKRVGPDMRLNPNYHEVAAAIAADPGLAGLGDSAVRWANEVKTSPDGSAARDRLREAILADAAEGEDGKLLPRTHELAGMLKEPETPGSFPKVGPSLRHAAAKLGFEWAYSWLRNPQEFRPSTKMPRFFGLWEHLEGAGLEESRRYEPIEIRSMIHYLGAASEPFDYIPPAGGITAAPDVARGKKVFQLRGCLACHQHADFPEAQSTHGPDLSLIGAKAAAHPKGKEWLYSWLREPARYHPKTIMPNVLLEPERLADGTVADPAADATAYLMTSGSDWKPAAELEFKTLDGSVPFPLASAGSLSDDERKALDELALMYLKERFPTARAQDVLAKGIDATQVAIKGDEQALVGLDGAGRDATLLAYVGKKTLAKLACYSCHDIPGFEDAKPAGAALADWGRKESSRIAFEQASHFVMHQIAAGHGGHGGPGHHGHEAHGSAGHGEPGHAEAPANPFATDLAYVAKEGEVHVDPASLDPDTGFFLGKLLGHEREGFLWQKLRAPRSYDYKKVENKTSYNERYRMPQFPFNDAEREAVMTFVLGLVAEPPAPQFVHKPSPREQARLDGLVVAEQYNCGGCHTLAMDRWDVAFRPGALGEGSEIPDYPFLAPRFTPKQVAESLSADDAGRHHASLVGMPVLDPKTGRPQLVDEDGVPIEEDDDEAVPHRSIMLWHDAVVDGEARQVGGPNLLVPEAAIKAGRHYPAKGGDLARLLFPVVIEDEKQVNPNVKPEDAWGWLPPPLVGEGQKVQSAWLHKFLLNPHTIRPPAVLRMPKFNWSAAQAATMVDYFAAVDGAEYPYVYDPRLDEASVAQKEMARAGHLEGALRIVTNTNYCVKCHLVGDYTPAGSVKALAPQLERVHERLRPGYVHDWIANPKRFLPYTGMPVNIPFDKPVSQDLYAGNSEQQVDALTDLLMHFDLFAKRNLSLEAFLKAEPPQPPAAAPEPAKEAASAPAAAPAPTDAASSAGSPRAAAGLQ
jgi:cytochrome c551/c552